DNRSSQSHIDHPRWPGDGLGGHQRRPVREWKRGSV
ncbi:MAG: hypothetical protein AVDCRST_MAG43-1067, partial [uncultured Thermomicrobiales bacterium]